MEASPPIPGSSRLHVGVGVASLARPEGLQPLEGVQSHLAQGCGPTQGLPARQLLILSLPLLRARLRP